MSKRVLGFIMCCGLMASLASCAPKNTTAKPKPSSDSANSLYDQRPLFFSCSVKDDNGNDVKNDKGETKLITIKNYKDSWKYPSPLDCMAQGEAPDPTEEQRTALSKVQTKDDASDADDGFRRVLAECASTTGYPIDGRSDTNKDPNKNPFASAEAAKDGYKVLAFCPDHPQAARIKQNADQASSNDAQDSAQQKEIPAEYQSALSKAQDYSSIMHMSKEGIREQLSSENGERFSQQAAQYAVDNLQADYNANALAKAREYQETMHMSPAAIQEQLTSQYGEKFTQEEAAYAIQHLNQ